MSEIDDTVSAVAPSTRSSQLSSAPTCGCSGDDLFYSFNKCNSGLPHVALRIEVVILVSSASTVNGFATS